MIEGPEIYLAHCTQLCMKSFCLISRPSSLNLSCESQYSPLVSLEFYTASNICTFLGHICLVSWFWKAFFIDGSVKVTTDRLIISATLASSILWNHGMTRNKMVCVIFQNLGGMSIPIKLVRCGEFCAPKEPLRELLKLQEAECN